MVYGTVKLNVLNALASMPDPTRRHLMMNANALNEYMLVWADCIDYDMGYQDLVHSLDPASFTNELVQSVERELRSTISDLSQHRPNSNAMYSARNATEKAQVGSFAAYSDRYSRREYSRDELWRAYRLAQFAAAEVIRSMTGRNQRAVVLSGLKG